MKDYFHEYNLYKSKNKTKYLKSVKHISWEEVNKVINIIYSFNKSDEKFLNEYGERLDWKFLLQCNFPVKKLIKFRDKINWYKFFNENKFYINKYFLNYYGEAIYWDAAIRELTLPKNVIKKNIELIIKENKINADNLKEEPTMAFNLVNQPKLKHDLKFVEKYFDYFYENKHAWYYINRNYKLNKEFLEKYKIVLSWENIALNESVNLDFLIENINYFYLNEECWNKISSRIDLTKDFISKYFTLLVKDDFLKFNKIPKDLILDNLYYLIDNELFFARQDIDFELLYKLESLNNKDVQNKLIEKLFFINPTVSPKIKRYLFKKYKNEILERAKIDNLGFIFTFSCYSKINLKDALLYLDFLNIHYYIKNKKVTFKFLMKVDHLIEDEQYILDNRVIKKEERDKFLNYRKLIK